MGMDVGGGNKKGQRADINVTPLIDIVLVLLIIFMVLTPSMLKHMMANVPKKNNDPTPPDPSMAPIVLEYTKNREISVNTEAVAFEALANKVAERLKFDKQKVVFFKIEDDAMYGEVVKLMDTVRGAGAKTLGIVTKDP
jgi:biopolymer transport protein TolR